MNNKITQAGKNLFIDLCLSLDINNNNFVRVLEVCSLLSRNAKVYFSIAEGLCNSPDIPYGWYNAMGLNQEEINRRSVRIRDEYYSRLYHKQDAAKKRIERLVLELIQLTGVSMILEIGTGQVSEGVRLNIKGKDYYL